MSILRAGGLGGGGLAVSRFQAGQIVSSGPITINSPNVSYFLPDDLPVQIPGAESGVADYTSGDLTVASALPSGLSLAQAGTTRYFNSSGVLSTASANTPRFGYEYDGTSWVQRGLRLEPARTNILLQSNTLTNAAWSAAQATVATTTATTSPDGTNNAFKIAEDNSGPTFNHLMYQGVVAGTAGTWTMSAYFKAAERNWIELNNTTGSGSERAYINLSNGTVGSSTGLTVVVTPVGNGWYRVATTVPNRLATDTIYLAVNLAPSDMGVNAPTYQGVTGWGVYMCFAQMEFGTGVSSYISTTTAATTRTADALTATAGGTLDKILSASGASVVVGSYLSDLGTNGRLVGNSSGAQSPAYVASNATAGIQGTAGTSSTATVGSSGVYIGSAELTGAAWDWTSGSLVANQGTVSNVNMGPQLGSGAYFFRDSAGTAAVIGFLQSVKAWSGRLSDTDLQTATNPSVNAVVAQTLGALVTAATDEVLAQATIAQTLGVLGQAAPATVLDQAVVAQTLSALAQAATSSAPAGAVTAQTLGAIGQTSAATASLAITVAQNLGALTQAVAGTVSVSATGSQTLGSLGQAAIATHPDTAAAAQTLGAIVQATTGGVIDAATAAQTLIALAQAAAASAPASLTASQTLGPLGQSVAATSAHAALVAQTLGAIAQATSGAVIDVAAVSQALGPLNQAATATAASTGFQAAQTLGGIVQALTGTAIDAATVAQALGGIGQSAAGRVVATIPARTDSLPALGQVATGVHVSFANVAQVLRALSQIATAQGPGEADFLAGQILGDLQQVAASNVPQRVQAAQALQALGQSAVLRITPVAGVTIHGSAVKRFLGKGSIRGTVFLTGSSNFRRVLAGDSGAIESDLLLEDGSGPLLLENGDETLVTGETDKNVTKIRGSFA